MRLVYRFGIALLVVVLLSGAVLAVTFDAHRTDVADNTDASVADHAELSASVLDERIEEQRRTITIAATNPDVAAHGTDRQNSTLERFVDAAAFDGATIVDENGTVRAYATTNESIDSDEVVGTDLSDRAYVEDALEGDRHVSDPLTARTGHTIITISVPIVDDGEVVGSINGAYHLHEAGLFTPLDDRSDD
ncbi:cache domain-containing protein [Natronolimnohabitans sp. A-GB9]|uniref:PDC sensor domain-containing protein n=1 Tax=Natronolimnohabitans sp. A-GB9 TaxID=3069757 RepID=UPI0027B4D03E|nr:cache domain-containing protein [Natronolimnohabitans sp. A-GB9]MDQ2051618.1 cache domain-containing protein [Natronolimnohabitans sp. A-GB9]